MIEIATVALSQPALMATSLLEQAPVTGQHALAPASSSRTAARQPAGPATKPSDWSMLLFGAGVLLLPRKRRVDNVVR